MTDVYQQSTDEVMQKLGVTDQGLIQESVQERRQEYGFNELEEGKRKSTLQVFFEQFKDFLVIILIVAAIISAFLGEIRKYDCHYGCRHFKCNSRNCSACEGRTIIK